jgi:hypothetical protein
MENNLKAVPANDLVGVAEEALTTKINESWGQPIHRVDIESIAKVCHEVNRAYCASIGDNSQVPWNEAPEWQRTSAVNGVMHRLTNPNSGPEDSHKSWLKEKEEAGWKYGPVKDVEKKEHPCFVPYSELPASQQLKDALFIAVVDAMR